MSNAIEKAYGAIQEAILAGRYQPGARLTERDIATALGVSRTPVREAIRQLAADGFVQHRPNSGVTVAELTEKALADLADLRAHLAEMAGRVAAAEASPADLDELAALARDIEQATATFGSDLARRVPPLLRRFHARVLTAGGNEWLARLFHQTTFLTVMNATYEHLDAEEWRRIAQYFPALVEALRQRDGDLAGSLMRAYFRQAKHRLLRASATRVAPR